MFGIAPGLKLPYGEDPVGENSGDDITICFGGFLSTTTSLPNADTIKKLDKPGKNLGSDVRVSRRKL